MSKNSSNATKHRGQKSEVSDVTAKREVVVQDHGQFKEQRAILNELVADEKATKEAAYLAKLVEDGTHIYTLQELSSRYGITVDPTWSQERIQWVGEVGEIVHPVLKLQAEAEKVSANYLVPGRKAVRSLIEKSYDLYLKATNSPLHVDVINTLKSRLKSAGITVHKDTPDASVIIRSVFNDFNSKQMHLYGKALEYAKANGIAQKKFAKFVEAEGGFEKIRTKVKQATKQEVTQLIEERAISDEERQSEVLEFRRTEPLIELELTKDQYARLKPNVTVTTPDKNMDLVVLLAEMDPYDHKFCNIYGTVPMTPELRQTIYKTLGQFIIFDADFMERFYAWKDKQPKEKVKKNAKERMSDRVTAWIERDAKRKAKVAKAEGK